LQPEAGKLVLFRTQHFFSFLIFKALLCELCERNDYESTDEKEFVEKKYM
jgi:hypothetical protein